MKLAENEKMIVRTQQAKRVMNKRYRFTKDGFVNSLKEFDYYKKYINDEGNAKMNSFWRTGEAYGSAHNGNKYFRGYEVSAIGIRNSVAAVGIPFYSFDAYFSKRLHNKRNNGNLVN